jgi:hypothetical protein
MLEAFELDYDLLVFVCSTASGLKGLRDLAAEFLDGSE